MQCWNSPWIRRANSPPSRSRRNTGFPPTIWPRCCATWAAAGWSIRCAASAAAIAFIGDAKRLTLMDVISLFEDISADTDELPPQAAGQEIAQGLRFVLTELDTQSVATLRSITLSTMLKLVARRPWAAAAAEAKPRAGQRGARARPFSVWLEICRPFPSWSGDASCRSALASASSMSRGASGAASYERVDAVCNRPSPERSTTSGSVRETLEMPGSPVCFIHGPPARVARDPSSPAFIDGWRR